MTTAGGRVIEGPLRILSDAVAEHAPSHVYALFSGGHDSLISTYITAQHPRFSGVIHCNTGIGIDETREFVRSTCAEQGWPLDERTPPRVSYEQICLAGGMPGGPTKHQITYHRLKNEAIKAIVAESKTGRHDRIVLSTGIRRQESNRRMLLHPEPMRREGARVWVNPILDWSALEVGRAIEALGLKRNRVVDLLHRSGECLCGALADPDEIKEIEFWFPEVARRIHALERECDRRGLPNRWGRAFSNVRDRRQQWLPLCQDCQTRWDTLL
jgi:3'-phosphoadenosine 5'-phosphosulfate sulfotransferase (PAPS reductase)/FAD synthetase